MNRLSPKQFAILIGGCIIVLLVFQLYQNETDRDEYQERIDMMVDATEKWLSDHQSIVGDETHMTINLYLLKQDGYIANNLKNPSTGIKFSNNLTISIIKKKNNYEISVLDDVETSNENYDDVDAYAPRVLLRGNSIMYTEINKNFEDPGVITYNSEGGNVYGIETTVTKDDVAVSGVDVSNLSTYDVQYVAEYAKNYGSIHRIIIVQDTKSPKINAPKLEITLDQVDNLDLMSGVVVTDNSNQKVDVSIEGNVSKKVGKYLIVYKAVDSSGNETTKKRVVRVYETLENISSDNVTE